jgi:hypothetical protein
MKAQFQIFFGEAVDYYAMIAQRDESTKLISNILLTDSYFSAFTTEFIDSQLEWIFTKLTDIDPNSRSCELFTSIATAHHTLIPKLVKMIIEKLKSVSDIVSRFWHCALGSVLIPVPQLLDVFEDVVKIIEKTIATDEKGRFESVELIVIKLLEAATGVGALKSSDQISCGKFVRLKEINPNLYHVPENKMIDIAEAVYAAYHTTFEIFSTLQLKQQLSVVRILIPFERIVMLRGHCATMIFRQLPSRLDQFFIRFLGHIRE